MVPSVRTMQNLKLFQVLVITIFNVAIRGAVFRDVGDLLRAACSSRYSSSDSTFRWMILLRSKSQLPPAWLAAVKNMECIYEVRRVDSMQEWNTTGLMPNVDYKVIAIGIPVDGLRRALDIYVSGNFLLGSCRGTLGTAMWNAQNKLTLSQTNQYKKF